MARAGKSPGSVFLSQNQSQAVGHWTFPGTAKKPASSLESALDPLPGASLAATVSLPQPHCGLYPCLLLGCFQVSWSEADVMQEEPQPACRYHPLKVHLGPPPSIFVSIRTSRCTLTEMLCSSCW